MKLVEEKVDKIMKLLKKKVINIPIKENRW